MSSKTHEAGTRTSAWKAADGSLHGSLNEATRHDEKIAAESCANELAIAIAPHFTDPDLIASALLKPANARLVIQFAHQLHLRGFTTALAERTDHRAANAH